MRIDILMLLLTLCLGASSAMSFRFFLPADFQTSALPRENDIMDQLSDFYPGRAHRYSQLQRNIDRLSAKKHADNPAIIPDSHIRALRTWARKESMVPLSGSTLQRMFSLFDSSSTAENDGGAPGYAQMLRTPSRHPFSRGK